MDKITVLIIDPPKQLRTAEILNTLETLQNIVGGTIEPIHLTRDFVMIINRNGKEQGLQYNCCYANKEVYGPFIIAKRDRAKVASISPENVMVYKSIFKYLK